MSQMFGITFDIFSNLFGSNRCHDSIKYVLTVNYNYKEGYVMKSLLIGHQHL